MEAVKPRVVVVGAGFGGLEAARNLAKLPVQVTVIDRKNHHTFQPLLYQVATAGISPGRDRRAHSLDSTRPQERRSLARRRSGIRSGAAARFSARISRSPTTT